MNYCSSDIPDWLQLLHDRVRRSEDKYAVGGELQHLVNGRYIYSTHRYSRRYWFVLLAQACIYVEDASLATQVLSHFARSVLDADVTASWFERLRNVFGMDWFRDLWSRCGKWGHTFEWTPDLVSRLDVDILATVLDAYDTDDENLFTFDAMRNVLVACLKVRGVPVVPKKWIRVLETWEERGSFPVLELARFLWGYFHVMGDLQEVKRLVLRVLDAELEKLNDPGWSLIVNETGRPTKKCRCQGACTRVMNFLRNKYLVKFECQMSVRHRNHVIGLLEKVWHGLPLEWKVRKNVRPHALLLVKKWWLKNEWPRRQRYSECVRLKNCIVEGGIETN